MIMKSQYNILKSETKFKCIKNKAFLCGVIEKDVTNSHNCRGLDFYQSILSVKRISAIVDKIYVIFSKYTKNFALEKLIVGTNIKVYGRYRSCKVGEHKKIFLYVDFIEYVDECESGNNILEMIGVIGSDINYYVTNTNMPISKTMINVKRRPHYYDCIPCVAWYGNAELLNSLSKNDEVKIFGRMQTKNIIDKDTGVLRLIHEVAIDKIEKI